MTLRPKLTGSLRTSQNIQARSVTLGGVSSTLTDADNFSINLKSDQGVDLINFLNDTDLSIVGGLGITTSIDAENNTLTITLLPATNDQLGGAQFDSTYFTVDSAGTVSILQGSIDAALGGNSVQIGDTEIGLGDSADTILGLASLQVGEITGNTIWNGATIPVAKGGTGITDYTKGDILFALDSDTLTILPIGSTDESLMVSSTGTPYWSNVIDGGSF